MIIDKLSQQGVLPLFFHRDAETSVQIVKALYDAGIHLIEYTNRGPEAVENFRQIIRYRDQFMPDMLLGAGTIKTSNDAKLFLNAGADFIISPGLSEAVGELVKDSVLWMPGCMTPSEIMRAESAGARVIKLFPGNLLGPSFVDAVKELFPALSFVPTGGVRLEITNLQAWFKSGVIAVGAGSTLIDKKAIDEKQFERITHAANQAIQLVREAREGAV